MRSAHSREKGAAIVESAIVLPVFFIVLIGIMEFGLVFHNYLTLQNAVREGARFAAIGSSEAAVEQRVRDFSASLDQGSLAINIANAQGNRGTIVTVDSSYPLPLITPMMKQLVGQNSFALAAEASMRLE